MAKQTWTHWEECLRHYGNEDGASSPLPHPCHANAPDVMGTGNSWGCCTQAACERLLHLQKPNPSVKPGKGLCTFDKVLKTFLLPPTHLQGCQPSKNVYFMCAFPKSCNRLCVSYAGRHPAYERDQFRLGKNQTQELFYIFCKLPTSFVNKATFRGEINAIIKCR